MSLPNYSPPTLKPPTPRSLAPPLRLIDNDKEVKVQTRHTFPSGGAPGLIPAPDRELHKNRTTSPPPFTVPTPLCPCPPSHLPLILLDLLAPSVFCTFHSSSPSPTLLVLEPNSDPLIYTTGLRIRIHVRIRILLISSFAFKTRSIFEFDLA
jgi:hypothetical protein